MLTKHWESLRNYESFELVKKDYEQRHGREISTDHAREIAAPFAHARSYFSSARDAEQTVKPLLLYYGVVGLTRGLTLALSRGRRETTLAQTHGISITQWRQELSKKNPDFSALSVAINHTGTFVELGRATNYRSLLRHNSSAVNYRPNNIPIEAGAEYTLGEILGRMPALQNHYRRWRGTSACSPFTMEAAMTDPPSVLFKIMKLPYQPDTTREFCDALFHGSNCTFDSENGDYFAYRGQDDLAGLPGFTDHISHFTVGDVWLTARYSAGPSLSNVTALFLLSYTLGMLVRYFPTQWTALIRSQISDAALPTIAAAIETIEAEYPRIVLAFLAEPPQE
ncbi:YaaC family protein [Paraburkholderia nemoris]|uniref:YaaC family protein n=1 Tax=Paraburkholderia nemoris TaxID=2793076 RepID=UPI001B2A6AB9|nr:YaaC family protein [Paraburkholderia nemoris]CAE6724382.1 hypothetical protein LMG22931_01885 [Paraburkholderia nemoris]